MRARIVQIDDIARRAKSLQLAPVNGDRLPTFVAGSHIKVAIPNLSDVRPAPFSLVGAPGETSRYEIVVHYVRGAGLVIRWLHNEARCGSLIDISEPRAGLELQSRATNHCLVAGGSGITAFLSYLEVLRRDGQSFELHYTFRHRADGIWCNALLAEHNRHVRRYVSAEGERLDLSCVLSAQAPGTHVYVCGPPRLIQSVVDAAHGNGFSSQAIHWDKYGWQPRLGANGERARLASRNDRALKSERPSYLDNF